MSNKSQNLLKGLFSKVRERILGLLYGKPDEDFHTNEIIRLTNMGSCVVQRELEKLFNLGLIDFQQVGNQKRYKANQASPLFEDLRSIILKTLV